MSGTILPMHDEKIEEIKRQFSLRLGQLIYEQGKSQREVSLDLGQSNGYVHKLVNGINLPSMHNFFVICEYLEIEPAQFFEQKPYSAEVRKAIGHLEQLDEETLKHIVALLKVMTEGLQKKTK